MNESVIKGEGKVKCKGPGTPVCQGNLKNEKAYIAEVQ